MAKELNNLEKALSAIAKKTKTAADNAAEAKEMAAPAKIATAVNGALSEVETAAKVAALQAKHETGMKLAIERGVYYLEDALTEELRGKVLSGLFKTNKQTPVEAAAISRAVTEYIERIPNGSYITARQGSVFSVDKNVGYKPDVFGTDGRKVTVGGMTLTIDGAQPCIYIRNKSNCFFDFRGVMFIAESFGVNVFEMDGGEGNVIMHGGVIRTRRWMEKGYVGGRQGLFAPIDGWTPENPHIGYGYADKGLYDLGFNTTRLLHDLARYRNNAAQVQDVKKPDDLTWAKIKEYERQQSRKVDLGVGGFWNADGTKNEFPQEDGSVSEKWGKWSGGQRGSSANGWLIYDVYHLVVWDFDVRGMTGSAIQFGLYSTRDCRDVSGGDIDTAIREKMVCYDCKVYGGFMSDNYIGGIGVVRGVGITVEGMNCLQGRVGHPDASVEHSRDNSQVTVDPGYWLWTSRYLPQIGIRFINNHFGFAARKVADAHTGNNIQIIGNSGSCLYYGTGVVIEETYAQDTTKGGRADNSSFKYQESNIVIKDNEFISGMNGIFLINGATGVKARKDKDLWWLRANITVQNNHIYAPRGVPCNFGHNRFTISDNSCTFALPFGEAFGLRYLSNIAIKNGGTGYSADTKIVITGGGEGARGAAATCTVANGVITGIRITASGTKYSDAKSLRIEAVDPTGSGSGAVFEGFVNDSTYAYLIGAESKYGTIDGSYFANNTARNSPDGNYARQFLTGNLTGCTVRDNRLDVTPYTKGDKPAKPYISDAAYVHRSGIASQGFYQTGTHTDCCHDNNKTWDQRTGAFSDHVFRNTTTTQGTAEGNVRPTKTEIQALIDAAVAAAVAKLNGGTASDAKPAKPADSPKAEGGEQAAATTPAQPPKAEGDGQPATQPPAAPPKETETAAESPAAKSTTSVKFTFDGLAATAAEAVGSNNTAKLKTLNNAERAGEPLDWAGAFGEDDGHKIMRSLVAGEGKGIRFIESEGLTSDGSSDSAIVFPFKQLSGGAAGSGFSAVVLNDRSIINNGLVSTNEEAGFKLRSFEGTTIDGKPISATQVYSYNKWYVAVIPVKAGADKAFNKIRFGMNHAGNVGRNVIIGAGIEFVQGDISKVSEKVTALMTEYGIATS
jgi:hypothetical protein|nr:MAG TPA: hypothetical protein [Caudoviricetes sp.]